jgi:RimJ/RimL family protein N-acetyltransferase
MPTVLQTDRLLLRTWTLDDVEAAFPIYRDPEVVRFIGNKIDQSPDDTRQRLLRRLAEQEQFGLSLWAAIEKATGQLIGACGLKHLEGGPQIEVGYHLARHAWGKGYATEGARACLRHGFDCLRLERIVGIVDPDNLASRHVLEKIGLTCEGAGYYYNTDVLVYAAARPGKMVATAPRSG